MPSHSEVKPEPSWHVLVIRDWRTTAPDIVPLRESFTPERRITGYV
jgi:hypothetical protein